MKFIKAVALIFVSTSLCAQFASKKEEKFYYKLDDAYLDYDYETILENEEKAKELFLVNMFPRLQLPAILELFQQLLELAHTRNLVGVLWTSHQPIIQVRFRGHAAAMLVGPTLRLIFPLAVSDCR